MIAIGRIRANVSLMFYILYSICRLRNSFTLYSYSLVHHVIVVISCSGAVPIRFRLIAISSCFAIFNNAVHSLENGETPSYSASNKDPNYVHRS